MITPTLTDHARQRCVEMGISTKVAKRIVQHPSCDYPAPHKYPGQRRVVSSSLYPHYIAIVDLDHPDGEVVVVTVLLKSEEVLLREEANERARALLGPVRHSDP